MARPSGAFRLSVRLRLFRPRSGMPIPMGSVGMGEDGGGGLLTGEEEVAFAREIESGEREVREAVFSLDLALQYVLTLAEKLRGGEIEARHIFGDDEP